MKQSMLLIFAILFTSICISQAQAKDKAVDGLLIGAGGGAILGQALGRDTESTLIGTAIGGALGYMIGNEQEKYHQPRNHRRSTVRQHSVRYDYRDDRHHNHYRSRNNHRGDRGWRHDNGNQFCKQTERTIIKHGRTKTIIKRVCSDNRGRHDRVSRRHVNRRQFNDGKHNNSHFVRHRW